MGRAVDELMKKNGSFVAIPRRIGRAQAVLKTAQSLPQACQAGEWFGVEAGPRTRQAHGFSHQLDRLLEALR